MSELDLIGDLYGTLPRQGPGCPAATAAALDRLGLTGSGGIIADMGCGSGAAARELADRTTARIIAIDRHTPFLARLGHVRRVLPICADMARPPLASASLDLLWSECAIYHLGFAEGLRTWRPLLRPTGAIAVSELTWLSETPPEEAQAFWAEAYPAMATVEHNLAALRACGFSPLEPLLVPDEGWTTHYYRPLAAALAPFAARHRDHPATAGLVGQAQREIDLRERHGGSYGYVFYPARVTG